MPDGQDGDPYAVWACALAKVDRVFDPPPELDRPVVGCTYCMPEFELSILGGDPAAVSDDLLGYFMREVVSHWDADQYPILWRRLMPRALRSWDPDGPGTDPSEEISHLGSYGAGLVDWPGPERAAVERALRVLLAVAVTDGRAVGDITSLVDGMATATGGLEPWLECIAGLTGPTASAGLVRLAVGWATEILWEDFRFSWYDGDPQVVTDWLLTQQDRIADYAAQHPRCKNAADALTAIACLRRGEVSPWLYPYHQRTFVAVIKG